MNFSTHSQPLHSPESPIHFLIISWMDSVVIVKAWPALKRHHASSPQPPRSTNRNPVHVQAVERPSNPRADPCWPMKQDWITSYNGVCGMEYVCLEKVTVMPSLWWLAVWSPQSGSTAMAPTEHVALVAKPHLFTTRLESVSHLDSWGKNDGLFAWLIRKPMNCLTSKQGNPPTCHIRDQEL